MGRRPERQRLRRSAPPTGRAHSRAHERVARVEPLLAVHPRGGDGAPVVDRQLNVRDGRPKAPHRDDAPEAGSGGERRVVQRGSAVDVVAVSDGIDRPAASSSSWLSAGSWSGRGAPNRRPAAVAISTPFGVPHATYASPEPEIAAWGSASASARLPPPTRTGLPKPARADPSTAPIMRPPPSAAGCARPPPALNRGGVPPSGAATARPDSLTASCGEDAYSGIGTIVSGTLQTVAAAGSGRVVLAPAVAIAVAAEAATHAATAPARASQSGRSRLRVTGRSWHCASRQDGHGLPPLLCFGTISRAGRVRAVSGRSNGYGVRSHERGSAADASGRERNMCSCEAHDVSIRGPVDSRRRAAIRPACRREPVCVQPSVAPPCERPHEGR